MAKAVYPLPPAINLRKTWEHTEVNSSKHAKRKSAAKTPKLKNKNKLKCTGQLQGTFSMKRNKFKNLYKSRFSFCSSFKDNNKSTNSFIVTEELEAYTSLFKECVLQSFIGGPIPRCYMLKFLTATIPKLQHWIDRKDTNGECKILTVARSCSKSGHRCFSRSENCCFAHKQEKHNSSYKHLCVCKKCRDKVGELFQHLKKSFRFIHFTRREYILLCGYVTCNANDLQVTNCGLKSKCLDGVDRDGQGGKDLAETNLGVCNFQSLRLPQNVCYGATVIKHPSYSRINIIFALSLCIILVIYSVISLCIMNCFIRTNRKHPVHPAPKCFVSHLISIIFIIVSAKNSKYDSYNDKKKHIKENDGNKISKSDLFKALQYLQNHDIKNTEKLLHDIIHYTSFRSSEVIHAYPVIRGDFSNELVRVGTLSAFPYENSPSLIRLAASGFYYDGKGRELKCFSCGLAYDSWSSTSIPLDIHRQLSPDCPFIKERFSAQTDNETDSSRNRSLCTDTNSEVPALLTSSSALPVIVTNGPDSALGDFLSEGSSCRSNRRGYNSSLVTSCSRSSGYSSGHLSQESSGYSSGNQFGSSNGTPRSPSQLPALAEDSEPTSGRSVNRNSTSQPDNSRNIPPMKYPEYQTPEKRFATYKDWPSHLTFLYPRDLVECGFFYSNFGDCVRCFHCGIGLRNWEEDDNPWVEHARWSRKCPYLIQRKGQEFIDSVLSVLGLQTDAEIEAQISNATTDRSSQPASSSNDVRDPITHPAAQYVIKENIFGENIDRKIVKKAMNQLIQAHDWESITNDMLVNIMLENKNGAEFMDTSTSTNTIAEVQQQNDNTSATSNSKESKSIDSSKNTASSDPEKVQKENEEIKDLYTCKICLDERVGITFVPCGHLVTCKNCSPKIRKCPLCRTFIRGTIKTTV